MVLEFRSRWKPFPFDGYSVSFITFSDMHYGIFVDVKGRAAFGVLSGMERKKREIILIGLDLRIQFKNYFIN